MADSRSAAIPPWRPPIALPRAGSHNRLVSAMLLLWAHASVSRNRLKASLKLRPSITLVAAFKTPKTISGRPCAQLRRSHEPRDAAGGSITRLPSLYVISRTHHHHLEAKKTQTSTLSLPKRTGTKPSGSSRSNYLPITVKFFIHTFNPWPNLNSRL